MAFSYLISIVDYNLETFVPTVIHCTCKYKSAVDSVDMEKSGRICFLVLQRLQATATRGRLMGRGLVAGVAALAASACTATATVMVLLCSSFDGLASWACKVLETLLLHILPKSRLGV